MGWDLQSDRSIRFGIYRLSWEICGAGAEADRSDSSGQRLLSLSGKVNHVGFTLKEIGFTLKEIVLLLCIFIYNLIRPASKYQN